MGMTYYLIDTETNHLSEKVGEIIQISIIRCSDKMQITRDIKCENPNRSSPDALRITNKTIADIIKGPPKEDIVKLVDEFIGEDGLTPKHRVIIGHNIIKFDKKWLHALWDKVGKKFPADYWLDTLEMAREYSKKTAMIKPKLNLKSCLEMFKIAGINRYHAANTDAINNFLLWQKLMEENIDHLSLIKNYPHLEKEEVPAFPEF